MGKMRVEGRSKYKESQTEFRQQFIVSDLGVSGTLIPSSFQQLMSSCPKDLLILHKFLLTAKQTSLRNSWKEGNVCLLPAPHPFPSVPTFPTACGVLVASTRPPGGCSQTSHLACQPPALGPAQGHSCCLSPLPQITWFMVFFF